MTGNKIFERAMMILGYTDNEGCIVDNSGLQERSLHIINQILADLKKDFIINDMDEDIELNGIEEQTVIYGVCMMLTLGLNDSERNSLFTELYNLKRTAARSEKSEIKEKLYEGME